ncbi:hypothetical protein D3C87_1298250 [compost metagenome]
MAAAVLDGPRDERVDAFQALPVRREDHDELFRQQGGADAGAVRAARARIDEHVAKMLGQGIGEAAEQGRARVEQLIPAHLRQALAVAGVEAPRAHQVQRTALVDAHHVLLPVDGVEHALGQRRVLASCALSTGAPARRFQADAFELLAARFEELEHARSLLVLLEIMVQARRFHVPVQHQHGHAGVFTARQQDGDIRQGHGAAGTALVGIESDDFARGAQRRQGEALAFHDRTFYVINVESGEAEWRAIPVEYRATRNGCNRGRAVLTA